MAGEAQGTGARQRADAEWAFFTPHLTLMTEDALQQEYSLREGFNGLRYTVAHGQAVADDAQRPAAPVHGRPANQRG